MAQTQAGPALQPLPPPPIAGYQSPYYAQPAPAPGESLELDIERSMAAIAAESGPVIQGGFALRGRSGEDGLSRLTEIGVPIEGYFSPFYTGTARLQVVPTYLTAGKVGADALLRFGKEAQLALVPGTTLAGLPLPGSQNATGVALNVGYAYQMFAGEIGTTPLGFPVENLVGRLALVWPGPATLTTAYPRISPVPTTVTKPLQIKLEGVRQAVTDSLLSYAGTKDPVSGLIWGGVIKTGGNLLASYDDGDFGVYAGGGGAMIDGKSVADNSQIEGIVGAYVRPWRTQHQAFKVGLNLSYMGYEKNLRFFTFGQGGYFSPQNYLNLAIPLEYTGQYGRFSWLAAAALGIQTFHEDSSPFYPTDAGKQNAMQAAFGNAVIYPARNVTGPSFNINGQLEYQLDNGFSLGGLAGINNSQNFTEGVGKIYLRKSFGLLPAASFLPRPLAGSL
jgi:cellulose synthase operon protein C